MAKFKTKGLDRYMKNFQKKVVRALHDKKILESAVKPILDEARKGKSPKTGRNFAALKPSTIKSRQRLAKYNSTSPSFSPSKSNLTFTGQLIDSIVSRIRFTRLGASITVTPSGNRKAYKKKDGKRGKLSKDASTNLKLAKLLAAGNPKKRNILEFSQKNIKEVVKRIKKGLKRSLGV